ncbi:MAG: DUF2975 domain-containing protein [Bacilli bacterium]|nr:DUF2975 domain-containing protein [Bacilli bacterium]
MEILGKKGLGSLLKNLLLVGFIVAIPCIIISPFLLNHTRSTFYSMVVIYPNGILMLMIIYQFMKLFRSLENNNPFCMENVSILKKTGKISLIMSILWLFDLIFMMIIIHNFHINYILVLLFLIVLFFGVFIALYILAELMRQATEYKEENDLTI